MRRAAVIAFIAAAVLAATFAWPANAQRVAIRDLVLDQAAPPARLMGYGLVTGLSGTGDRVTGTFGSRQTVQSIVNLLRRFDVQVPAELLRTRNVAAVLVTAEVSPYMHAGGRFDVSVSSIGDATSLRGGVLWMTPLVTDAGAAPIAGAQGSLAVSGPTNTRTFVQGVTTGRVPQGGVLETELPRPAAAAANRLLLRDPDIGTATRIAAAVDSALGGKGNAMVLDPGSVQLTPKDTASGFALILARVRELTITPVRAAKLVIDSRDGTVVTGADMRIGDAMVSHDGISVIVGADSASDTAVRAPSGASVRDLARALQAMHATAAQTVAIFSALRDAGAFVAEVVVR
ncbi:MAG TPA: flagellar basal body P-ring protein FlgI [Gemmatimonadaceae bacterium]|nr:flagellar basal body P-ring protein FlgI [Gemmatimonadaceae bacterium]